MAVVKLEVQSRESPLSATARPSRKKKGHGKYDAIGYAREAVADYAVIVKMSVSQKEQYSESPSSDVGRAAYASVLRAQITDFRLSLDISSSADKCAPDSGFEAAYFLQMIYRLDSKGSTRLAVDLLIDQMDDALNAGDFDACESVLGQADTTKLSDSSLVTLLGITLAAKRQLWQRRRFFEQAWASIAARRSPDGAEKLLAKYR